MGTITLVAMSVLVPFACLGLLLALSWLEDTLQDDVRKSERRSVPEPIVAMPVATPPAAEARTKPAVPAAS